MKLLFVAPTLKRSGMEKQLVNLLTHLHKRSHNLTLALYRGTPEYIQYELPAGLKIVDLKKRVQQLNLMTLIKLAILAYRLKPDLIFSTIQGVNGYCHIVGGLLSIPVICSVRATGQFKEYRIMRHLKTFFPYKKVICNSNELAKEILSMTGVPHSAICSIPNGIDMTTFTRQKIRIPVSPIVLLYVGRIAPSKNLMILIKSLKGLQKDAVRLRCVGEVRDTGYFQRCLDYANELDVAKFISWQEQVMDVVPVYSSAHWFVLPSVNEGCPNALLEAMSCGLPAIVSNLADRDNIVRDGISGYRFPADDSNCLHEIICNKVTLKDREKMGTVAREDVAAKFDLKRNLHAIEYEITMAHNWKK